MNSLAAPAAPSAPSPERQVETAEQQQIIDAAYETWQDWRRVNHIEMYSTDVATRRQLAEASYHDAIKCEQAIEIAGSERQRQVLSIAVRELKLNSLFLVPEEATEEKLDMAVDLSIDMVRERTAEDWQAEDFGDYMKLYDLQHLIAYWEASQAMAEGDPVKKELAMSILGGSIMDAADDLQRLLHEVERADQSDHPSAVGRKAMMIGQASELAMITTMRLKSYYDGEIQELFLRSALGMEDSLNSSERTISSDTIAHYPSANQVKFLQCKSGGVPKNKPYDAQIEMVVVDGTRLRQEAPWAVQLLKEFVDATDYQLQAEVMNELSRLIGFGRVVKKYDNPSVEDLTQQFLALHH